MMRIPINETAEKFLWCLISLCGIFVINLNIVYFPTYFIMVGLVATWLFPKFKIWLLVALGFIEFSINFNSIQIFTYTRQFSILSEQISFQSMALAIILFLSFIPALLVLSGCLAKWLRFSRSLCIMVVVPIFAYFTYNIADYLSEINFLISRILIAIAILIASHIWLILLYDRTHESNKKFSFNFKYLIQVLNPFWIISYEARPHIDLNFFNETKTPDLTCLKTSAFLVTRGVLVIYFLNFLNTTAYAYLIQKYSFHISNANHNIYDIVNILHENFKIMSIWDLQFTIILNGITFLFESYYGYFSSAIGIGYLFGLKLPHPTNQPWNAVSFEDFCGRFMSYYSSIILIYFYYPFLKILYRINLPRFWRTSIASGLAIGVGCLYFHVLKYFPLIFFTEKDGNFIRYLNEFGPYCLGWGLMFFLFRTLPQFKSPRIVKFIIYMYIYAVLFSFRELWRFNSIDEVFSFYFRVLTFGL